VVGCCEYCNELSGSIKCVELLDCLIRYELISMDKAPQS